MAALVTVLRCMIVAIRYATTTKTRIESQSQKVFSFEDNESEFMGTGWRDIKPQQLDTEIKHCMIRNEVENLFYSFKALNKFPAMYK